MSTMDRLEKALATASCIRLTFVETTVAVKALEARHLCGPVAGSALAEAVTAAALLSADAASADEAVMLRMSVVGPLGGVLAEATGEGGLRGYTTRKVLDELDSRLPVDTAPAWGPSGSVQIVTSVPGKILNQAVLTVQPPQLRYVTARYFNHSLQIPTACAIEVSAGSGGLISARGLLAQRMVDSDIAAFVRVLEAFEDGRVSALLRSSGVVVFGGAAAFCDVLGLPDITVRETRPLMFKCRCSRERMLSVLDTLSREELEERISEGGSQDITCHMCGRTYSATMADIQAILDHKSSTR